jgi:hypothetical protein
MMSPAEKRGLILAHAAARAPQDPLQRMSLWAGVTLCVLMLIVGWWSTVGWTVRDTLSEPSSEVRALTEELDRFTEQVQSNPLLVPPMPTATSEATAASFDDLLKSNLQEEPSDTAPATRTRPLLEPAEPKTPTMIPGLAPHVAP